MSQPDLIEQRQYAETVLGGLNIRPFRVDLTDRIIIKKKNRVNVVRKLCKHFDWPFVVSPLTQGS